MRVKFRMAESEIVLVEDAAEPETSNALIFQVQVAVNAMLRTSDGDSMECVITKPLLFPIETLQRSH